eukprot:scaffold60269_cov51-Attheya_sp.AAC.9
MFSSRLLSKFTGRMLMASAASMGTLTSMTLVTSCIDEEQTRKQDKGTHKIVVVGGGTAGIGVAAMLRNEGMQNVIVIEPSSVHYYQPLWTLVGGGIKSNKSSVKPMKEIIPKGTNWVQKRVSTFTPDKNKVTLDDGTSVDYDYLVVAAGIQSNWDKVPGVLDGLKKEGSGVASVYDYTYSEKTWKEFQLVKDKLNSIMIFTMPPTVIKCAGAPQKIMWLLEDILRSLGLRDRASIQFWVPGGTMFGVKHYAEKLEAIRKERGVIAMFRRELVSLDVDKKVATFKNLDTNQMVQQNYDLIHVVPHMCAPDFIRDSTLANKDGWVDVDKHTMQSTKYQNVFGLGDCTSTPNSKTTAAITSQAPVVVHNIIRSIESNKPLDGKYNGYASCPLIVARNRVILAEFGYDGKLMETFSRETGQFPLNMFGTEGAIQQRFFFFLKEQLFPFVYWKMWVHGRWYGAKGPFKPDVRDKDATQGK